MWKAWLTVTWRNFLKHRSFSLLNVAGLSLGIASLITIFLYVHDELEYDRFHANVDHIYRVTVASHYDGSGNRYATTATPLAPAIASDVPDVQYAARLFERQASIQLTDGDSATVDKKYFEDNFYLADPEILSIFSFKFLTGDPKSALADPHRVILTRKIADKYFGSVENALGKQLLFEGRIMLEVSAVIEDYPDQSTHDIGLIAPFENYFAIESPDVQEFLRRDWLYNPLFTYVLLKPESEPSQVLKKIQALNDTYADERVRTHVQYQLQPLADIHLYSDFTYASQRNGIRYVYVFAAIGLLILVVASINFINLSTIHAMHRAREIGVRKVVGALKSNLVIQFLTESGIMTLVSFVLAVAVVYFLLPMINPVTGKNFDPSLLTSPFVLGSLTVFFVITTLMAGIYPAIYITRFNPLLALKGLSSKSSGKSHLVRRFLVVTQFSASILLIVVTVVIYKQVKFMQDAPLGFQKDHVLTVPLFSDNPNSILGGGVDGPLRARMNAFENELLKHPSLEAVTVSSALPGRGMVTNALVITDKIKDTDNVFVPIFSVDYDFIDTYKMQLLSGRSFSREAGTDHLQAFIANEKAIAVLGFENPEKAIGQSLQAVGKSGTIVGVIKDYHFEGLQQPLRPLLMEVAAGKFNVFSIRLTNQDVSASIETVQKTWNQIFPEKVFEYSFLDQELNRGYEGEQRFGVLINLFAGLAIFISALGLFGLAAFVALQKQKEAGIRKVLGASTAQVFYSLSREFVRIIAISVILSVPLSVYAADLWLGDFANRIVVGWQPFGIAFGAIIVTVLVSTAYQTLKTATINPVETLKND